MNFATFNQLHNADEVRALVRRLRRRRLRVLWLLGILRICLGLHAGDLVWRCMLLPTFLPVTGCVRGVPMVLLLTAYGVLSCDGCPLALLPPDGCGEAEAWH